MTYGSTLGQDRWIIQEVFPNKKNGYFVEAGALNGVDESNTVVLERDYQWTGLCVEPAQGYFEILKRERNCQVANLCLLDHETEVEFLEAGGHGGIPAHFSASYGQTGRMTRKRAVPLRKLLDDCQAPSTLDYLSLDTEGTEYLILKNFPFDRYRFLAITVEHNGNLSLRFQLRDLLSRNGYILCREVLVDDWWVHQSHYTEIDESRRDLWKLLNQYPLPPEMIRYQETLQKYSELFETTNSIRGTLGLLSRQTTNSIRGTLGLLSRQIRKRIWGRSR